MKLAIMQPYFMPYIGYFQAIAAVDKYILYSNVNFIKESWINRNRILMKNGEVATITVPLLRKSSFSKIRDIQIDNTQDWQRRTIKMIEMNYKHAPFFQETFPLIRECIAQPLMMITDLNAYSISRIANYLDIPTEIASDDTIYYDIEDNLSVEPINYDKFTSVRYGYPPRKVTRILEICSRERANEYINAIGGQELYDKDVFSEHGIRLSFIKTKSFSYKQWMNKHEPNLSIIDVLMFNGKEDTKRLLTEYTLI